MNNDYIEFLVNSAKSGRKNAFLELSDFYLKKIFSLCFFITADINISKILTKRIFLKTWEDIKNFNSENLFSEWFYDLAIRLIYDELKTKYIATYLVDDKESVDEKSITDKLNPIEKVILELEQDDRFIFVLHDIEKYSLDKIGRIIENNDIEKQGAHLFNVRDEVLQNLGILDEETQIKLLGRYNEILSAKNSDELSGKLEPLSVGKEKHYELVYFFTTLNSFQPEITPPEDIRESIFNELFKQGLEEKTKHQKEEELRLFAKRKLEKESGPSKDKKEKVSRIKPPKTAKTEKKPLNIKLPKLASKRVFTFAFFTCVIIAVAYYYTFFQKNTPWEVELITGRYRISNGSEATKIFEKQTLISNDDSEVLIKIPEMGSIKLLEASELTLNKGTKSLSEVILLKGAMEVTTGSVPSGLITNCGQIQVIDLGSISSLSFKAPGDSRIEVIRGLVEVKLGNDFVYLIRSHICDTRLGAKPGIPYRKNTSQELIGELKNLQYQNGGFEALTKIINAANEQDVITLWHLFPRVELTERELVYSKITEYFPLSQGIEKREIMNLDQVKLKQWFDDIRWQL